MRKTSVLLALVLSAGATCALAQIQIETLAVEEPVVKEAPAADAAWSSLAAITAPSRPSPDAGEPASPPPNWAEVAVQAQSFRTTFPDDPRAVEAVKIELVALIRADRGKSAIDPDTAARAQAYIDDPTRPVRGRLAVKIALGQTQLLQNRPASRTEGLAARAAQARDWIAAFPNQPEGYGYLLALSKAESPANARQLAGELIASSAPERFKAGAARVLRKHDLVGQPLQLEAAGDAIAAAQGKPLIVYSWSLKRTGFLQIIRRLAENSGAAFIGVNLDEDTQAARQAAAGFDLPGTQIYDGHGLDGPAAQQLQLTMTSSLYLVDAQGVVVDVNGHQNARAKLLRMTGQEGGRP